jgi:site-specific recombinase XerD
MVIAMVSCRKRGSNYHADYMRGRVHEVRGSLGTRDQAAARRLVHRLELAIAGGRDSEMWVELSDVLPSATYERFATHLGITIKKPATWSDLRLAYETDLHKRQSIGVVTASTVKNYLPVLKKFDEFLSSRAITFLRQIDIPLAKEYKYWRVAAIQQKKGATGGSGFCVDAAVLHSTFKLAVEHKMILTNPFFCQINRGSSERGSQPFDAEELRKLRTNTEAEDRLLYTLLRWTGLRKSDVVRLRFENIDLQAQEIRIHTMKSRFKKEAIITMKGQYLLPELQLQADARSPLPSDFVLLNDKGEQLNESGVTYLLTKLGKRAGVRRLNAHRFRDTFAVDMLYKNCPDFQVASMLADTTETVRKCYMPYVRVLREKNRDRINNGADLEDFYEISGTSHPRHISPKGEKTACESPLQPVETVGVTAQSESQLTN